MRLRLKEDRDTDCRSDGKTNKLPLGQVEHDLRFDAVKILSLIHISLRLPDVFRL